METWSKSIVSLHLVPVRQRTTEREATQDRQGRYRQMQVRRSDDGHTRGGGVPRTRPVVAAEGRVGKMEKGPRGTGKKKRGGRRSGFARQFLLSHIRFPYSISNTSPIIHTLSFPARYAISFV